MLPVINHGIKPGMAVCWRIQLTWRNGNNSLPLEYNSSSSSSSSDDGGGGGCCDGIRNSNVVQRSCRDNFKFKHSKPSLRMEFINSKALQQKPDINIPFEEFSRSL